MTRVDIIGVAGGTHYTHDGGATNYVCLPRDPIYGEYTAASDGSKNFMYGAEYEMNPGKQLFLKSVVKKFM